MMMLAMVEILLSVRLGAAFTAVRTEIYTAAFDAYDRSSVESFEFQRDFYTFLLTLLASRQDKGSDKQMDGVDHKLCN